MASLRKRFESFVKTMDGFEDIDALLKNCNLPNMKRADYLFDGRKIIVEQKVLEIDPVQKPQQFMDQLMAQGRFILLGGQVSTKVIFDKLPDGEELRRMPDVFVAAGGAAFSCVRGIPVPFPTCRSSRCSRTWTGSLLGLVR